MCVFVSFNVYSQDLNNLDNKYGFNKFKLEESIDVNKQNLKFISTSEDGVQQYEYLKSDDIKVFNVPVRKVNLFYYERKLMKIQIIFNSLTEKSEDYIFTELRRLFGNPQREYPSSQYSDFLRMWLSDKTSLHYAKLISSHNLARTVSIEVISFKLAMKKENNRF